MSTPTCPSFCFRGDTGLRGVIFGGEVLRDSKRRSVQLALVVGYEPIISAELEVALYEMEFAVSGPFLSIEAALDSVLVRVPDVAFVDARICEDSVIDLIEIMQVSNVQIIFVVFTGWAGGLNERYPGNRISAARIDRMELRGLIDSLPG